MYKTTMAEMSVYRIVMDFYDRSMEKRWKIHGQPMYSKQYAPCMQPIFSILIDNPSFLHGVHGFSMEFHDVSMGNPWYIPVRVTTENFKFWEPVKWGLKIFDFCTLLASPVYKKVTALCDIAK